MIWTLAKNAFGLLLLLWLAFGILPVMTTAFMERSAQHAAGER